MRHTGPDHSSISSSSSSSSSSRDERAERTPTSPNPKIHIEIELLAMISVRQLVVVLAVAPIICCMHLPKAAASAAAAGEEQLLPAAAAHPRRHRLRRELATAVPIKLAAQLHRRRASQLLSNLRASGGGTATSDADQTVSGLRPTPTQFGGDPTGHVDSTGAVQQALQVCLAAANNTGAGTFSVRSKDAGGCVLDLDGGEWLMSEPLVIPTYVSNIQVADGSLVANPHSRSWRDSTGYYDGGHRYLIEIGETPTTVPCVDHGPLKEGSCNEAVWLRELFLDGRHAANGVLVNKVMGTTIGQSYLLNFTDFGIMVNKGHEVMVDEVCRGTLVASDVGNCILPALIRAKHSATGLARGNQFRLCLLRRPAAPRHCHPDQRERRLCPELHCVLSCHRPSKQRRCKLSERDACLDALERSGEMHCVAAVLLSATLSGVLHAEMIRAVQGSFPDCCQGDYCAAAVAFDDRGVPVPGRVTQNRCVSMTLLRLAPWHSREWPPILLCSSHPPLCNDNAP
eukprot:SAG31_NODE_203_length_20490_cov_7.713256_21_plen_513_part_00